MFGAVRKHVLCHDEKGTIRKHKFPKLPNVLKNFPNPQNAIVKDSLQLLHCLLSLEIKVVKG